MIRSAQTALAKAECKSAAAAKSIRPPLAGRQARLWREGKRQKAKVMDETNRSLSPPHDDPAIHFCLLPFAFIEDAKIVVDK